MDIRQIRQANLALLVQQITARSPSKLKKDVAAALDLSPSFLSQLLNGKLIGDDLARKIEVSQRLAYGWMDHAQQQSPPQSHDWRREAATLAAATRLVRLCCEALELKFDPENEDDAAIVLMGMDYLIARSERAVTPDNLVDFTKRLRDRGRNTHEQNGRSASAERVGGSAENKGEQRKVS